jgi:hypothetical protein
MGRPGGAAVATTAERLAEVSARSAGTVVKEPGALATAARTAIAVAPAAGVATAAAYGVKKLAEGSAMSKIERAQAERKKKRREQGLPEEP